MKLHTSLTWSQVHDAMSAAKDAGHVTRDIEIAVMDYQRSRSHDHGYEIKLGTWDQSSGPKNKRYRRGTGTRGAAQDDYDYAPYAATYDEWGWFIAELFRLDPGARFGHYRDAEHFHEYTRGAYRLEDAA